MSLGRLANKSWIRWQSTMRFNESWLVDEITYTPADPLTGTYRAPNMALHSAGFCLNDEEDVKRGPVHIAHTVNTGWGTEPPY